MVNPLVQIETWPVANVASASVTFDGERQSHGDIDRRFELASITKIVSTWAILIGVEEGSITLETPIGQNGCTLRHLLSHAGGYGFDGAEPVARPGRRRIYSNTGIEMAAAALVEATGIPFHTYVGEAILDPLGMTATALHGSAAFGMSSTVSDLLALIGEITRPTLLDPATVAGATTAQFADLPGVLPGLGVYRPCPWGLGVEIHGAKSPHWMGRRNSPAAFGHFGGAGTMMWIDPVARTSLVALTDRRFELWSADALRLWPELSDAVVTWQA